MTESDLSRDKLHARTDASHRIGIDTCGLTHYYDCVLGVAWTTTVFGDIAHVTTADLEEWVVFVKADRGWTDCQYSTKSLADELTDALRQEAV